MAEEGKDDKAAEREARERYETAVESMRDGAWRFTSKLRGQADIIIEELADPDGDAIASLADVEGDAGALALSVPIELITFETWLFGQVGDEDELDLDIASHRELWFNFGAWLGETLRRRHGGHWLITGENPAEWRLGFSKVMLEIVPWVFAEQLIRIGPGMAQRMLGELERLRLRHEDQKDRDDGNEIDRFTAQHYVRMHTVPLGQWMVFDFGAVNKLWHKASAGDLIKEIRKSGKKMGPAQAGVIDQLCESLAKADQGKPIGEQTADRGLFEAISQIIALRKTSSPIAMDVLEKMVIPSLHIGVPADFPPLDDDDLGALRKGVEYFSLMIECVPHKHQADDEGFMGSIPHDHLRTPYRDQENLEVGQGDWVMINPSHFQKMLIGYDSKKVLDKYDEFVKYVSSNPKAPRRRDDGRMLAETVVKAVGDIRTCVSLASKQNHALVFRMLPPPA